MHAHKRRHCSPQRVSRHHQRPAAAVQAALLQQLLEVFRRQPIL